MLPESGEAALCFDNMNYRNKETKRHRNPGIEVTRAPAVPYGTSFYWGSFPGTSSLAADFRGRFATFRVKEREVGETFRRSKAMEVGGEAGKSLGRSGVRPYGAWGEVLSSGQRGVARRGCMGKGGWGLGK